VSNSNLGKPLEKVAADLGVNLVLRGHVSSTQQLLKIVVNLQNISDVQPFWTQEFSGKRSELLTIQDQVYDRLLDALGVNESEDQRFRGLMRPVIPAAAYDL